jgi:hypothetical protein
MGAACLLPAYLQSLIAKRAPTRFTGGNGHND